MIKIKDYVATFIIVILVLLFFIPLFFFLYDIFYNGIKVVLAYGIRFFIDKPPNPGFGLGGIGPAIEGSLFMVGLALLITVPISFFTGIFLTFYDKSKISKIVRYCMELIVEFPTIIIGIVVFSIFVVGFNILTYNFKIGINGISGAIALSIVMLPYTTIQINESLKIPRKLYEEVAYSLGLTTWQVIKLVISAGRKGVITGLLIGFAKIIGETAPILLVTSSTANLYLTSLTTPITGIPVLIYNFAFSAYENLINVAWGASFTLILIVIITFVVLRRIS
jgi:phosphate transport system permease protein